MPDAHDALRTVVSCVDEKGVYCDFVYRVCMPFAQHILIILHTLV